MEGKSTEILTAAQSLRLVSSQVPLLQNPGKPLRLRAWEWCWGLGGALLEVGGTRFEGWQWQVMGAAVNILSALSLFPWGLTYCRLEEGCELEAE